MSHEQSRQQLSSLQAQISYAERLNYVTNRIHAAREFDQLFVELHDEILSLFDAERFALYAIDYEKKEVYSRFSDLDKIREIRVPLNDQSIVGFVARNRMRVNIANAYDKTELEAIRPTLA